MRFCPNCGTEVDETALFCPTCGQAIDQAAETAMPAAPAWPEPATARGTVHLRACTSPRTELAGDGAARRCVGRP